MPGLVANTWNPSALDLCFEGFMILSLSEFVDGDREEMLLCPVRVVNHFLTAITVCVYFSTGFREKCISRHTMFSWLHSIIIDVYRMTSDRSHMAVKAKAHEICSIGSSLLFRKNFAVQ